MLFHIRVYSTFAGMINSILRGFRKGGVGSDGILSAMGAVWWDQ